MEGRLAPLRLGSAIRFRDRWQGRLAAFEVDEAWTVINLVVTRGLLRPSSVKLPFSAAQEWSAEGVALECTTDEAFSRVLTPVAAPGYLLSARTRMAAAGVGLMGALVERANRRASQLLLRHAAGPGHELRVPVEQARFEGGVLSPGMQIEQLPLYRSDEELERLVREALARHAYLSADDRRCLTVRAADGLAVLGGNVRTPQASAWAQQAAAAVPGATAVRNEIADDVGLEMAVAQAVSGTPRSINASVYARSSLGEVTLFGYAPSAAAAEELTRVTAGVSGVRSVHNRLETRAAPPQAA